MSGEAIVIGTGVDALVAAHTLTRAGMRVRVVGRAAPSAHSIGWMPPGIVRALDLTAHGVAFAPHDPWASAPLPGGGRLEFFNDISRTAEAISRVSPRDAAQWPAFCERMHAIADLLGYLYCAPPPDPLTREAAGYLTLARTALRARRLGRQGIEDLLRVLPMSIADLLDDWFEDDTLKGVLGAAGVMHLCQGPRSGGTAFNFLHHHVGSAPGVFRQAASNAHSVLHRLPGVQRIDAEVTRIEVEQGRVTGVVLDSGEAIAESIVVSSASPQRTLVELIDPGWLDPELVRAIGNIRSRGVVTQVTLTLEREPGFTCHVIAPSLDYLERAYDAAKYRRIAAAPYIEARHMGAAPGGVHEVRVHVQYTPAVLDEGAWDSARADRLAAQVIGMLNEAVPGFASRVTGQRVLTPHDFEHTHGCPQGQTSHAEIALDQMLWMRPVPALAQYRTPVAGLYLCGPAMHPGAAILGAAGAHAARTVSEDMRRRPRSP